MRINVPGKSPIQIYPSGGMFTGVPGGGVVEVNKHGGEVYLLNDNFGPTEYPAGSVNGTNAEPGPGVRTVVDTESNLSIANGKLTLEGKDSPTGGNPGLWYGSTPIVAGKMLIGQIRNGTDAVTYFGWDAGQSGVPVDRLQIVTANTVTIQGAVTVGSICTIANNTDYKLISIRRTNGYVWFIKGGIYSNWTPLYFTDAHSANSTYPSISIYSGVFTSDFIRIPTTLWLPTPLLSDGFGSTFGLSDGLGHAEGIAGGLGAGGGGLVWLNAGTWATAAGVVANTPVAGVEKLTNGNMETGNPPTGWFVPTGASAEATQVADERTGGTGSYSLNVTGYAYAHYANSFTSIVGKWYRLNGWQKSVDNTTDVYISIRNGILNTGTTLSGSPLYHLNIWNNVLMTGRAISTTTRGQVSVVNAANNGRFDDISVKPLPISTLITESQLSTTDVLAEMVISAYTLGSQVGIVQADRSFAAKAAATAAAGQAVLSLKEVTGVGGVGLAVTDGITVNGTVYTIASVTGGSNVAYNDTTKTQTITLGANLGAEVLADAKVGLDWASWNGSLHYFDGAGNLKIDEILAGVYTNRESAAKAFSAGARLIVRKIGSEYRLFYGESLIGTQSAIAAGAMTGLYWGMFSTLAANTITSFVVYDTGNVTNAHSILDKYSAD